MRHEKLTGEIRETAALYALHSLNQHEARAFELHLQDRCQVCEKELKEFERVVADLGIGVRELQPPDYLGDLLMARIEHESLGVPRAPRMEPQAGAGAGSESSSIAAPPASVRRF